MTGYIKNIYLNTPLKQYKYFRLRLEDTPKEIVIEYKLQKKSILDVYIYL